MKDYDEAMVWNWYPALATCSSVTWTMSYFLHLSFVEDYSYRTCEQVFQLGIFHGSGLRRDFQKELCGTLRLILICPKCGGQLNTTACYFTLPAHHFWKHITLLLLLLYLFIWRQLPKLTTCKQTVLKYSTWPRNISNSEQWACQTADRTESWCQLLQAVPLERSSLLLLLLLLFSCFKLRVLRDKTDQVWVGIFYLLRSQPIIFCLNFSLDRSCVAKTGVRNAKGKIKKKP